MPIAGDCGWLFEGRDGTLSTDVCDLGLSIGGVFELSSTRQEMGDKELNKLKVDIFGP